jgi:hypothetical protein
MWQTAIDEDEKPERQLLLAEPALWVAAAELRDAIKKVGTSTTAVEDKLTGRRAFKKQS